MTEEIQNELVVINKADVMQIFTQRDLITPLLEKIEQFALSETHNVDTLGGRKAIASVAYRVAQSKTYIESHGKDLAAELKELPKLVDSNRKYAKDYLDELRDRVRKPLVDWEIEQARIKLVQEIEIAHEEALVDAAQWEIERTKLIEKQAQEKAEHEARIASEAAAKATKEAEEKARREIIEAEARALSAEKEIQRQAEQAARDIEQARIDAERKAKHEQQQATEELRLENERMQNEKQNTENVHAVHKSITDDLLAIGLKEKQANYLLKALLLNKIKALRIEY